MTPTVIFCTMRCLFCWRVQPEDVGFVWNELEASSWDDPKEIVEGCIAEQRRLVSGYKGNPKVPSYKYDEALSPKHAAISLSGEPTLYPMIDELIREFHRNGLTTFLVTNGTMPETLSQLGEEPTQLYVSLCAPNKKVFKRTCRPQIAEAWERIAKTLGLLPSLSCRTVIRITLVKGLNMGGVGEYAKLIEKASPDFVEPKAAMYVGFARKRMGFSNMPTHSEVQDFAINLATALGYNILDSNAASRVVLLSKLERSASKTGLF